MEANVASIRIVGGSSGNEVKDNTIQNDAISIFLEGAGSNNIIQGNNVSGTGWSGIQLQASNSNTIQDNILISNPAGIRLVAGSANNLIFGNTLTMSSAGVLLEGAGTDNVIDNNDVSSSSWVGIGIVWSNGNRVQYNTLHSVGVPNIYVEASSIEIYTNDISNGSFGMMFTTGSSGIANYNNIAGNEVGVINYTPEVTIDATSNWWGHASGPGGDDGRVNEKGDIIGKGDSISGNVEWDPYLPQPSGHTKHDPVPPGLLK